MHSAISSLLLVLNILNLARVQAGDKPRPGITFVLFIAVLTNIAIR